MTEDDSARLADCLVRFQQDDPDAGEEFQTLVWPYLKNLSRKIAPYLAEELHEDVAQHASLLLFTGYKFNPHRATVQTFLPWIVRNAARKVWADNRPPGFRSRRRKAKVGRESEDSSVHRAEFEAATDAISLDQVDEKTHAMPGHRVIMERSEVESLLTLADPLIAEALQMIYREGDTVTEAATELGVSRFKLSREISKFQSRMKVTVSTALVSAQQRTYRVPQVTDLIKRRRAS